MMEFHFDDIITSPNNQTLKLARSLSRRKARHAERALLVEGSRAIDGALRAGAVLRSVIVELERAEQVPELLLQTVKAHDVRLLAAGGALFRTITTTEEPQPIVAIVAWPELQFPRDCSFILVLDAVRDPGNMGTLIRSAAAAGADGVALLPGCVDPTNEKVVRASAGSMFTLPVLQVPDLPTLIELAFTQRPQVVVTDARADTSYDLTDFRRSTAIVISSEAHGLSDSVRTYADVAVSIPMAAEVESLNAAVAGSVLAFEVSRQRRLSV